VRVSILALDLTVFSVWSLEKRLAVCLCFVKFTGFVCLSCSFHCPTKTGTTNLEREAQPEENTQWL
jgi:hypothetical protein